MNGQRFHRWMILWALAATLALALVPTIGRLAGLGSMPMHHAMSARDAGRSGSTMPGSKAHPGAVVAAAHTHNGAHGAPAATGGGDSAPAGSDEDCAYCPLLLGTTALPVPVLQAAPPWRSLAMALPAIRPVALERHPTGLGSRGPPRAA